MEKTIWLWQIRLYDSCHSKDLTRTNAIDVENIPAHCNGNNSQGSFHLSNYKSEIRFPHVHFYVLATNHSPDKERFTIFAFFHDHVSRRDKRIGQAVNMVIRRTNFDRFWKTHTTISKCRARPLSRNTEQRTWFSGRSCSTLTWSTPENGILNTDPDQCPVNHYLTRVFAGDPPVRTSGFSVPPTYAIQKQKEKKNPPKA